MAASATQSGLNNTGAVLLVKRYDTC